MARNGSSSHATSAGRTTDGGHTWAATRAGTSSCNAGAGTSVDFVDPHVGWMIHLEPTGPGATIRRASDGGATWSGRGLTLPAVSPPRFTDELHGWVAGYANGRFELHRTADAGHIWTIATVPGPPCCRPFTVEPDPPTFFGNSGVFVQESRRHGKGSVAFDTSDDGGSSWRQVDFLRLANRRPELSVIRIATPTAWWVIPWKSARFYRTADAGTTWHTRKLPPGDPVQLSAIDGRRAWLTLREGDASALYITLNGGRTWRLVRFP